MLAGTAAKRTRVIRERVFCSHRGVVVLALSVFSNESLWFCHGLRHRLRWRRFVIITDKCGSGGDTGVNHDDAIVGDANTATDCDADANAASKSNISRIRCGYRFAERNHYLPKHGLEFV